MAIAMGRSPEEEFRAGLSKISRKLHGQTGLLFTKSPEEDVHE